MRTLALMLVTLTALPACKKEQAAAVKSDGRIAMEVTGDGFVPANVTLKAGQPVIFVITRKTDETCATDLLIEGTDIKTPLPLNKPVEVAWTPTKTGKVKFGCAMDMMVGGVLLVE